MALRIQVLGTLRVEQGGRSLDRLPAQRIRCGLLLYLAMEREASRQQVMGLFWPDRPPDRARHLLSQTLYELRQELGEDWLHTTGEQLSVADHVTIDALDFAAAVEAGEYRQALDLYGGAFLGGANLAANRDFEGWLESQQARLTRLHRQARRGAIDAMVEAGELGEALAAARTWVDLDPLDDEAQHRVIELLAATGDRAEALRQYDRYARVVEQELELEPLDETKALVERIRQGEVGERPSPRVAEPRPTYAAAGLPDGGVAPEPADAVPAPAPVSERAGDGRMVRLFTALKQRVIVRWTLTYLAGAVVLLEGTDILIQSFGWPEQILRMLTLLAGFGALVVLGIAWLHSEGSRDRVGLVEAALFVAVLAFAGAAVNSVRMPAPRFVAAEAEGRDALDARRIAVLYFQDNSTEQDLEPLAAGFTEALIHELAQIEVLEVLSRTAVAPFRRGDFVFDSMVSHLRAGTLVEGSLTRVGDRLRLTVQLIDGASGLHRLSRTLDRPADQIALLLEELPKEAAILLRQRLGIEFELRESRAATSSGEAWALVQRTKGLIEDASAVRGADLRASLPILERADSMLALAERLDPDWPEPTIRRAQVAARRALAVAPVPSHYDPATTEIALGHLERVLAKWPDYPPALEERGILRHELAETGYGDDVAGLYRAAEADLRQAVMLDPGRTRSWWGLSQALWRQKSHAEAKRAALRAVETDAFLKASSTNLFHLFTVMFDGEDHAGAREWCDELAERFQNSSRRAYCELFLMTSSPLEAPDPDRAWTFADMIVARAADDQRVIYRGYSALQVAKVLVRAGMPDSARAVLQTAAPQPPPWWAAYDAAHVWLLLGHDDEALESLQIYVDWNPVRARGLARDWWFRDLHHDPRFQRMIGIGPG